MHEIICPHCDKAFKIDEAGYADILKQIRNKEFDKEIHEKLAAAEQEKKSALLLVEAENETEAFAKVNDGMYEPEYEDAGDYETIDTYETEIREIENEKV